MGIQIGISHNTKTMTNSLDRNLDGQQSFVSVGGCFLRSEAVKIAK